MVRSKAVNRGMEVRAKDEAQGRDRSGFTLFLLGRILLMLAGIAIMGLGIDVVVGAHLGNSPISACPYVVSLAFPQISFGTLMLIWQCLLVLAQVVILRRDFNPVALWQVPISVFFGICIDLFVMLIGNQPPAGPVLPWAQLLVGIAVLAFGITMTVISGTVMNCGEAVVQAIVDKTGVRFGTIKVIFDLSCTAAATALSFAFLGQLEGVWLGTFVCAAFTGMIVNVFMGIYGRVRKAFSSHSGIAEAEELEPITE